MTTVRYCTPEWLEESAKQYRANPRFHKEMEKLSTKMHFQIKAEPAWGIEEDITFGSSINKGVLEYLAFFSQEDSIQEAEYVVGATPQEWKKILRKESKFITDFVLGKISLIHGSKVGVFGVAPYSNSFVDALTQVDLIFPDEMTPDELEEYRAYMKAFRSELGV